MRIRQRMIESYPAIVVLFAKPVSFTGIIRQRAGKSC
jgi:hypothetical protein